MDLRVCIVIPETPKTPKKNNPNEYSDNKKNKNQNDNLEKSTKTSLDSSTKTSLDESTNSSTCDTIDDSSIDIEWNFGAVTIKKNKKTYLVMMDCILNGFHNHDDNHNNIIKNIMDYINYLFFIENKKTTYIVKKDDCGIQHRISIIKFSS